ncbi:MAG: PH domain-containing protein, partial [Terracidiphilus sp.]
MRRREFAIRLLLRTYPAAWRHEFGTEFEELLGHSGLSLPVIVNVIVGGFGERVVDLLRRITKGGEMADHTFGVHDDRLTQIVSACVVLLLVALPLRVMGSGEVAVIVALVSAAVIALAYAYSPRGFEVSGGAFRVKRLIGSVVFPLTSLRFVRDATPADFRGSVRLWGSGGLFGYYGLFWSRTLGKSRWYVTDRSKAVVVTDGSQTVLVSPEDRDEFLAAIERTDAQAIATTAELSRSGRAFLPTIGLAVGAIALVLVAFSFFYAPGRPPVDLTRDSLVIHSRFYGMTIPAS